MVSPTKWCIFVPDHLILGMSHEIFLKENPHGDECCIGLRTWLVVLQRPCYSVGTWESTQKHRANAEDETTGNQLALDLQTVEGIELCNNFPVVGLGLGMGFPKKSPTSQLCVFRSWVFFNNFWDDYSLFLFVSKNELQNPSKSHDWS